MKRLNNAFSNEKDSEDFFLILQFFQTVFMSGKFSGKCLYFTHPHEVHIHRYRVLKSSFSFKIFKIESHRVE
jgi:hypothetical protein